MTTQRSRVFLPVKRAVHDDGTPQKQRIAAANARAGTARVDAEAL
jgi:hypothetical protein